MIRKILLSFLALLLLIVVGGVIFVASRQHLTFDPPYPEIKASTDPAVLERGHYLVRVAAPCAACHGDPAQRSAYFQGAETPLSGGFAFDIPPGTFYVPNLTSDNETGLGQISDEAIARALRHGVGHGGRALLPFMEMQGLSDDDLEAVVSYLRTMSPVKNPVPDHTYTLLGRVIRATALSQPVGPSSAPPPRAPRGLSVENGRYLAESVSLCWACHTE